MPDQDLLFELGTEEMPAGYVTDAIAQLRHLMTQGCASHRLAFKRIRTFGTPRRLVAVVERLAAHQTPMVREIQGPAKRAAYDAHGALTAAGQGFLKGHHATERMLTLKTTPKGEYLLLRKEEPALPTRRMLPALLPEVVAKLGFPKTMRWEASGVRFARPIRWIVALYGSAPVRCMIGGVRSGAVSHGHRLLSPRPWRVTSARAYLQTIARHGVLLDHDLRRTRVESSLRQAAGKLQRHSTVAPESLRTILAEVANLVEYPTVFAGRFDAQYLAAGLPREVILASMSKHQRVFAVVDRSGALLPRFLAIANGRPKRLSRVRATYEHILNARLADSLLFYQQDRRTPLAPKVDALRGVVFHQALGTMYDKTNRLERLVEEISRQWKWSQVQREHAMMAARRAKADLTTAMVREFPSLQGIMGGLYAAADHEPAEVAAAIAQHYDPPHDGQMTAGKLLSLCDKLDTLVGYLGLGLTPSGTSDPYGLKRCGFGILNVLMATGQHLSLSAAIDTALRFWEGKLSIEPVRLRAHVKGFLRERLEHSIAIRWQGRMPYDLVRAAVLSDRTEFDDVVDTLDRLRALQQLDGTPAFIEAAKVVERTWNILRGTDEPVGAVNEAQLQHERERELWQAYQAHHGEIERLIGAGSYREATQRYGQVFFRPLHAFFDEVMVNAPEAELRRNRRALMKLIHDLYTHKIADLSHIVLETREASKATTARATKERST
ncbi:MAG: glycine--tRNA ligase subunit beta [Candidatus Omnitrophica bacterium]|nr:glycine--tRNA ligase subunit beta [Candidatus Omnitrophota bacterium]